MSAHYTPYCLCSSCSAHTFFELGRSVFGDEQFVKLSQRYRLNEKQREKISDIVRGLEEKKLVEWNEMAKGEKEC